MTPDEAQTALEALRSKHREGEDVGADASALRIAVGSTSWGSGGQRDVQISEGDRKKARCVREHLLVGAVELPPGADDRLTEIVAELGALFVGAEAEAEVERRLSAYIADARDAAQRVERLREDSRAVEIRLAGVQAFIKLLDTLVGSGETHPTDEP